MCAALGQHCTQLATLSMQHISGPLCAQDLQAPSSSLRSLHLAGSQLLQQVSLAGLSSLTGLRHLWLEGEISGSAAGTVTQVLDLGCISQLRGLQSLDLSAVSVGKSAAGSAGLHRPHPLCNVQDPLHRQTPGPPVPPAPGFSPCLWSTAIGSRRTCSLGCASVQLSPT